MLVVEDQRVLADRIAEGPRDQQHGNGRRPYDGATARWRSSAVTGFDVIVLDRGLPGCTATRYARQLVASSQATARILMLTAAAAAVEDRVDGPGPRCR